MNRRTSLLVLFALNATMTTLILWFVLGRPTSAPGVAYVVLGGALTTGAGLLVLTAPWRRERQP